jgi:hypothetical protein
MGTDRVLGNSVGGVCGVCLDERCELCSKITVRLSNVILSENFFGILVDMTGIAMFSRLSGDGRKHKKKNHRELGRDIYRSPQVCSAILNNSSQYVNTNK